MILARIKGILMVLQFAITIAVVIALMYIFKSKNHKIRKIWAALEMKLLGITLQEHGKRDESADIILLNHQSVLDIVVMEHLHNRNIAWVAKKEIGSLPFYGNILKLPKMIEIDRENKTGIIKLLKEVKQRLSDGRPVALFPEGTRSDGQRLLKFKSGAKIIAEKYNLKVQPVIMINTRNIFDSKKITAASGIVTVHYLEPVTAKKNTDWYKTVEENMREQFKKEILK